MTPNPYLLTIGARRGFPAVITGSRLWPNNDLTSTRAGQWTRNGEPISGQTGESYRIQWADIGAEVSQIGAANSIPVPKTGRWGVGGDSITQQNGVSGGSGFQASGYAAVARNLMGASWEFVNKVSTAHSHGLNWTFGYGSYSAADYLNGNRQGDGVYPMQDVAAADPNYISLCLGSNPGADTYQRIIDIWDTWIAAGRAVVGCEILPRASTAPGYTSTSLALCYSTNAQLKAAAAARGMPFLEWADAVALSPGGFGDIQYMTDSVHPNVRGASVLGERWKNFISPYTTLDPFVTPPNGSPLWASANPFMTGGTTIATGWTPTGAAIATSKITDGDGTVWQRITATNASGNQFIRQTSGAASNGWAVGNRVRPVARVRCVPSGWAIQNVMLSAVKIGSPNVIGASVDSSLPSPTAIQLPYGEKLLVGPEYVIPSDATGMFTYLYVLGTGSVDVRDVGLVKVG